LKPKHVRMKGFQERRRLDDVLKALLKKVARMPPEKIPTISALGRIAYGSVEAKRDVPHFDRAAMDGYAVVAEDTFGCSQENPAKLKIVGEALAGEPVKHRVKRGEAVHISTGAAMPQGADAVVMVEYTSVHEGYVHVYRPVTPYQNVSRKGEDVKIGEVVLPDGATIRPQEVGLLLQCGVNEVNVSMKPKVAISSTGSELVEADEEPKVGRIVASNEYVLAGLTRIYGGEPTYLGVTPDEPGKLRRTVEEALKFDIAVFSGGTSVGKYDYMPEVIAEMGGECIAHGITIRPGGPTAVFIVDQKPVFCLPGFPVAAMISFESIVAPTIRSMLGAKNIDPRPVVEAVLARRVPSSLGRRDFVRVKLEERDGKLIAIPLRVAGSGILSSMTKADGVLEVPEEAEGIEEGERVKVKLFLHVF